MSINFNNPASLNLSLLENNPAGQGIGSFVANDTSGGLVTYSLSGASAGFFSIDNNGVLLPVRSFNYEQPADNGGDNIYDVVITARGTSGAVSEALAVRVLNTSEPPVFASPNIVAVPKNSTGDFYQILTNNINQADAIVGYQLRGPDAALFTLDSATGNISFLATPNYNVNGDNNYSIVAVVNASGPNGTYATSQAVQVNVVNETPAVFASASNAVNLTADNSNAFYQLSNVIDKPTAVNSYQILSGKDENLFWIDGDGAIYAKNGFDYDTDRHHYSIVVAVTTGPNNFVASQLVTIELQPSTAQPGFAEYQNDVTTYQNSNIITTVEAAGAGVYSYRLFWGDLDFISIDSASGQLSFISNSKEHYAVWVEASNNLGQQYYQFVNIDVVPGNAPTTPAYRIGFSAGDSGGTLEISENNVFGLPVGNYNVTDNTANGIDYSIIGGDQLDFAIDSNGQLIFNEVAYYKTKNNYSVVVVATGHDNNGAIHQISQAVHLIIDQVGGANGSSGGGANGAVGSSPVWTPITGRQYVLENTVGTGVFLNAVDPAGIYNVSYSLSDNRFSINDDGEVMFVNAPNYENTLQPKLFTLVATAFDMNGGAAATSVSTVIEVLNTNDSQPQIYDDSHLLINGVTDNYIFAANQPIDWSLSFSASDPDGGLVAFSLSDNVNFSLDNGNVTYIGPQNGTAQHYTVQLIATSLYQPNAGGVDAGNVASITQIIDIVGNPTPTPNIPGFVGGNGGGLGGNGAVLASIDENNAPNIVVGNFLATDAGGVAISYSVDGANFSIDQNGLLYFQSASDYEATKFYSAVITASVDGNSISQSFVLDILNTNDNAPALSGAAIGAVFENNAAGIALGLYQASDADGGAISYSVDNGNFSIDQNGLLYFNSAADYEATKFYSVIVTATSQNQPDNGNASNVVTKLVVVNVLNANDNNIQLVGAAPASFAINPNNTAGLALGNYSALDADGGSVLYQINDYVNFSIDQQGELYFAKVARYSTQSSYSVMVTAISLGQPIVGNGNNYASELVVVNVNKPYFAYAVSEVDYSLPNHNPLYSYLGSAALSDSEGNVVLYSVSNIDFSVETTGAVYFNHSADYATKNLYSAVVTAYTNNGLAASEIIVVNIIAPTNDYAPQFTMGPVNLSVLENYQQMTVAQYQATDIDGGTVSLSLSANNHFSLDSNGNLILFSRFDYEKIQTYSLVLNAHANNQPAGGVASNDTSLLVTISIGNMDDNNLVFATGVAFSSIQEGQAPGIAVAQYSAYDPDGGGISYSIVEATNSFSIDENGMVYFKATANASVQSLYLYSVVARSINQPAISYSIITDVVGQPGALTIGSNPNPDTYQFYLSSNVLYENASNGAAGYANIFDSQPGDISYWVGAGSNFIINQYGDLFNISAYDYESASNATLVVYGQSTGRGYPISQLVVVSIINVNDNAPQFVSATTSLSVLENTSGVSLAAYNGFDADGGGVVYSVSDSHFSIDSNGTLYLTSRFDYETNHVYSLVVTATSLGQPATGNASNAVSNLVVVSIGNVNDNAVQFTSGQALLSLTENNAAGQSLGVYQATDLDGGAITYGLSNATYFSLDSNNVLHFNSVANYDLTKFYSVVITAGSTNQPATGNASNVVSQLVVVDVLKEIANNHTPSFTTRNVQVTSVLEDSPAGIILGQFQATDLDGGNISYSIGSFNFLSIYPTFSIDQNGVVYLTNSPSFDQVVGNNLYTAHNYGYYNYTVVATSYNQPAGGSANNVLSVVEHLQLININDEVPYFYNWATGANENATTIFSIDQGNNPSLMLGTFYAADPDGGGLPIYSISNPTDFSIQTGYYGGYGVAVRLNSTTNYDAQNLYSLVITAQSTYQPLVGNANNYTSKLLVVNVLNTPVNNHAPVFVAAPVAVSMADNNASGVSIANFSAYDADNVGGISYFLSDNANFSIDQHGVVYFESVANYDVQSHYTLVVYAHSTNQPVAGSASNDVSQTLVLDIQAPWKNNNAPIFVSPPSTLAVHENIASTQAVYSFGVADADGARDGNGNIIPVTFSYSIDDTTHFSIDQGGAIYAKNVDYETSHFYTLLVTAMAQNQSLRGNASNYVSTSVVISIINDNDNAPVFAVSATRTTAYYDVSLTSVAAYSAVDADGGAISYSVNDAANFSITNNGQLNYVGPGFNGAPAHYSVIVTAQSFNQPSSGGAGNVVSVLEVLDVVDPIQSHYIPQFNGLTNGYTYTGRISEHNVTPLAIATFTATDAAGAPISYYLTNNPNNDYSISQDGKLYLLVSTNAASPSGNSINGLRINATTIDQSRGGTGGNVTSFVNYNLNISPINDPSDVPTFTEASYSYAIDQNNNGPLTLGHIVAKPVAYMPVANNVHYTLNDTANFALTYYSIDGSMDLRFIGNANHATTPYYSLIITATSANPAPYNQTTQLVVLAVSSVSTPPNHNLTFNSNVNSFEVSEANTTNVYIGNLGATDPDLVGVVNGISYSISGADSALFSLNKYTGDLTFTGQANYLNQTSYSILVTASTTNYQPDAISELVVVHVDQFIGNVVGNNVAANFDGMQGTNGVDSFTVYYSTGNQPWTGFLAGNTGIVLYNYNPNFDHITLNSFATNTGISGGPGGINSAQAFDDAYGNDISLLNGDINVLLGNGIQLYITRANDSNGNPQDFMSPTTGLANGHISFNDFLQLIGGSRHIDFVG
ncbi:MAG: cadherin repeat domain-containing protein [Hydrotalea sp.]|nr:cadherin repeat domain-containing protein [Hydrotalea sp.]